MGTVKKRNSLLVKFAAIFAVFTIVTPVFGGIATYENQNAAYHVQCADKLKDIANYLAELLIFDGEDFANYQDFCLKYGTEMNIPVDFKDNYEARSRYELMMTEKYPGKVLGENISFNELDHETQLAYATYNHEYYLQEFEKAAETFGIAYAYYIVSIPDQGDDVVMYLLDCVREEREDGSGNIAVCGCYPQVIERHGILSEAWNTGKSPDGYDSFDNEFGRTYAYYTPLYIGGEKLGLIATEVDIDFVNSEILHNALMQSIAIVAILIACVLLMLAFINHSYIRKIGKLESGVREYATEKDPSVAVKIEADAVGKHEIASLSRETAVMIRELDSYITNVRSMTVEKERLSAELNIAAEIQTDLMTKNFPSGDELCLFASVTPAKEMGGDFYDFFMIDDNKLALVMADVSGKGMSAALFMVITKTIIENCALVFKDSAKVITDANKRLCRHNDAGFFVTVWFGVLDLGTGTVEYVNAGHEYPIITTKDGDVKVVEKDNFPPLAVMEDIEFKNETLQLEHNGKLLLYTDGVTEAKSESGSRFGMDRLVATFKRDKELTTEEIVTNLRKEVNAFAGKADQFDDVTIMSVRWDGK